MAVRMFSEEQLERLQSFPDIARDDLIRCFTLTQADVAFVDTGRGRGPADRLGLAVQLCTLPWLGFVPDEVRSVPPAAVARAKGKLRGKQPKLTARQQTHLVQQHQSGEHTIADLAELFSVSRATVYRVLERHQSAPAPSTSCGL